MADTKISALSAATALAGTEPAPIVQGGATVKATMAQIATYVGSVNVVDTAYDATTWDSDTTHAPSKNAVRDKLEALWQPAFISANYYVLNGRTWANFSAALTTAPAGSTIYCMPFSLDRAMTIAELGARVETISAAGNFKVAIYASNNATGRPTGAALGATGNISTGTNQSITGTLGGNITIQANTVYWLAIQSDNGTVRFTGCAAAGLSPMAMIFGTATLAKLLTNGGPGISFVSVSQAFGSFPDMTAASFTEGTTPARVPFFIAKTA